MLLKVVAAQLIAQPTLHNIVTAQTSTFQFDTPDNSNETWSTTVVGHASGSELTEAGLEDFLENVLNFQLSPVLIVPSHVSDTVIAAPAPLLVQASLPAVRGRPRS